MESRHYKKDRTERKRVINDEIGGYGKTLFTIKCDRGHPNGPELHTVTENGIIIIFNAYTKIHVTDLIARPEQLKRYGKPVPELTLQKAKNHIAKGWNYV